jgi:endoglucanase
MPQSIRTAGAAQRRTVLRVMFLCSAALAGCSGGGSDASPTTPLSDDLVPRADSSAYASRVPFWNGVYLGDAETTPERVAGAIGEFAALTGKRPALVKSFHRLDADLSQAGWAGRVLHAVQGAGATNYVALDLDWEGRAEGSLLDAINRGEADARIDRAARGIALVRGIILVEAGWEMNGKSAYAWQGIANGADRNAPAKYVAAARRLVDRFRAAGASNVRWVFNPNTGNALAAPGIGSSHWNWYANYYPGDEYVDFVGAHGFNGPRAFGSPYHSFVEMFNGVDADRILTDMKQRFPTKPILFGEIGAEEVAGHDKGAWVRDAYDRMLRDPQIAGAVWFNMKKESDWRVNSSAASLAGYRAALEPALVAERYDDSRVAGNAVMLARR